LIRRDGIATGFTALAASPCNDAGGVGAREGGGVGFTSASGIDHTSAMTAPGFLKGIGLGADPAESTDLLIVSIAAEPCAAAS